MHGDVNKAVVDDFVSQKKLAVVGVSRNSRKFGNFAYHELKARGYQVFPVNPNLDSVGEDRCYPSLNTLPEKVDGVVVVVPPKETEKVVQETDAAGIKRVWMQQGAESEAAIRFCKDHGMSEVHGECILMFSEPVRSYHWFHRFVLQCFGRLPKA